MFEHKINLTNDQSEKLRRAYKKGDSATIRLKYEQLVKGKEKISLTEEQKKKIDKAIKEKKGLQINLNNNQLRLNHSGGFLPLLFAGLGALGALAGGGAAVGSTIIDGIDKNKKLEEVKRHNKELEKILAEKPNKLIVGSGLGKKKVFLKKK